MMEFHYIDLRGSIDDLDYPFTEEFITKIILTEFVCIDVIGFLKKLHNICNCRYHDQKYLRFDRP